MRASMKWPMRALAITGMLTLAMIASMIPMLAMRATPPSLSISACPTLTRNCSLEKLYIRLSYKEAGQYPALHGQGPTLLTYKEAGQRSEERRVGKECRS